MRRRAAKHKAAARQTAAWRARLGEITTLWDGDPATDTLTPEARLVVSHATTLGELFYPDVHATRPGVAALMAIGLVAHPDGERCRVVNAGGQQCPSPLGHAGDCLLLGVE